MSVGCNQPFGKTAVNFDSVVDILRVRMLYYRGLPPVMPTAIVSGWLDLAPDSFHRVLAKLSAWGRQVAVVSAETPDSDRIVLFDVIARSQTLRSAFGIVVQVVTR